MLAAPVAITFRDKTLFGTRSKRSSGANAVESKEESSTSFLVLQCGAGLATADTPQPAREEPCDIDGLGCSLQSYPEGSFCRIWT